MGFVDHPLDDRYVRGRELPHWTMELLCSGEISIRTSKSLNTFEAHSVMLIPPHTPYSVQWAGGAGQWTELYAIFEPQANWQPLLSWPKDNGQIGVLDLRDSTMAEEVEVAFQCALRLQRSGRTNRSLLALNALEKVLLLLDEINPLRGRTRREPRIEQALNFLSSNYDRAVDVETLAREVFLSPSRLSHLFKAQTGQAPMQYLEQYRLERAAEKLLSSQDSIEQIAGAVGFSNSFHFSTRFRRRFGQPPSRFRKNPG